MLYIIALWHRESHPIYFIEFILFIFGGGFIGLEYYQSLLLLLLLLAALADLKTDRIPNGLIVLGMILGLSNSLRMDRILCNVGSMLLAFLLLYPLFKIGALGAGDVKLFIMIGSFYETGEVLMILAAAFVIAGGLSFVKILAERNGRERMQYLLSYISEIMQTKQWRLYGEDLKQDYQRYCRNKIHFTVPVLFSVALKVGGII